MIQELNLAKKLQIHCGQSCSTGAAFESTLACLYHIRTEDQVYESINCSISFVFHFNHRQPGFRLDPRKTTFALWISEAIDGGFEYYKPQDLVYALRGQSYGLQIEDIVPDYDKSMEEVFVDALVAWGLSNLEAEYGSRKFVTESEAVKLANRLLSKATLSPLQR